jgi:hypothetical protein
VSRSWQSSHSPASGTCASCGHWGPEILEGLDESYQWRPSGHRKCAAIHHPAIDEYAKLTAMVMGMGCSPAALWTRPDFGCSLHQPGKAEP